MILREEQILIRDSARAFAQEKLVPGAAERDRTGEPPLGLLREMGGLGFMGMTVAPEWGGAGADYLSYVLAMEEIAAGDGAVSTIMSVNNAPDCLAIERFGTGEQKEQWLKPLARGEMLGAFALTEPQAGSDASDLKTRARPDGNGYVLNGTKQFITSGSIADVVLAFAVTDPGAGKRGITAFLVPTDAPGYRVLRKEQKLGQRASDTCALQFEDLRLPGSARLGEEGEGYRIALANLEAGRLGIAAQAVGMARAAFEAALAYAKERKQFGHPIIGHQAIGFRLAEMATEIEVARQMLHHAASLRDAGEPCLTEAAMAKLHASEMAERVCSAAIQIHGGYGYLADFPVERIYRDVRVCQIYEGTSEVQKIIIGRALGAG
ncbi:MAG TPA: acyl-CoA dehydrogenase family protein [Alphaproteobacteria bacterium]|jgi:alkylation response protein AidB-like acyl-CoA dehydrogenase